MFVDSGTPSSYKEGWPAWGHACEVEIGQHVILNSGSDTVFSNTNWPVSYPKFAEVSLSRAQARAQPFNNQWAVTETRTTNSYARWAR